MSIERPSCLFNLCSSCSSCSNKRRRDCLLPPPAAGYAAAQASRPHRTPIAGLAIALLTHTCCYSPATADEPVNPHTVILPSVWETTAESSPPSCRSLPRPRHRPPPWCSQRGWSMWSRNGFHRTWIVREEADSWVHGRSKEVPPYYAENNDSST